MIIRLSFLNKIITYLIFLLSAVAVSQNNGGFENWTTSGSYEEPVDWQTTNILSLFGNAVSSFKVSGTDKYSGNYALKVKTIHIVNKLGLNLTDTAGVAFNGKVIISPPSYRVGSPYTTRSQKLGFYAKYIPVGTDTGIVLVTLQQRLVSGVRDTIATGKIDVPPSGTFSFFEITLDYRNNSIPDTMAIVFASSKKKSTARVGSALFVDDVAFSGTVPIGIKEYQNKYGLKIKSYPIPANNQLTIEALFDEASNIEITDATGKILGHYKIQNNSSLINTSAFESGLYFFTIYDKRNKPLTSGKFNVIK